MAINEESNQTSLIKMQEYVQELDRRVRILESEVGISTQSFAHRFKPESKMPLRDVDDQHAGHRFESGFGEIGLAVIGNIVLLFGITFLIQFIQSKGYHLVSSLAGYIIVAGLFGLSLQMKKAYSFLANALSYTSLFLLFYNTLRLHFFVDDPLISSKAIGTLLVLMASAVPLILALRQKTPTLAGVALLMIVCTAVINGSSQVYLSLLAVVSILSISLHFRFGWWKALIFSIAMVYVAFISWFLNNPFMGNPLEFIGSPQYGLFYLLGIGAVFSLVAINSKRIQVSENIALIGIVVNGTFFTTLLVLFVISFYKNDYILLFSLITVYCLIYAVLLKSISAWKFTSAFFALYGFLALSITVFGIYGYPRVYWLLALQSLLVVSMALWFRNKIIVFMNGGLFVFLYLVYLFSEESLNEVNYSFALVALGTARIINWKKNRLEIKTELLRDLYLVSAFFMVLYALYHSMPDNFITLSWTIVAISYFVLSFLLKNVKYRYMALGTMIATAFHLFMVDLARIDVVYRVIAFLFLAIISIMISVFYTRGSKKSNKEKRSSDP